MSFKRSTLFFSITAVFLGSAALQMAANAQTAERKKTDTTVKTEFLRLKKSDKDLEALQTAITRYKRDRSTIDLIGAVHIGERDYYDTLNELFNDYDVVLYELVAEPGTRIPKGGVKPSTNPISALQMSAQQMLGLESQLQKIDYSKEHFVHADMSPQQLAEKMRERGDTPLSLAFGAIGEMMRNMDFDALRQQAGDGANGAGLDNLMELMTDPLKAKQFMARQFAGSGNIDAGLGAPLNQLVITDRNEAAVEVLKKQLDKGKRKVAIFYGAAHMPDFEDRLTDMSFEKTSQSWINAWDLTASHADPKDNPMSLLMQILDEFNR